MSETLELLGKLVDGEPGRDAVHIAVAPVTAGERLYPGQRVGFEDHSTERVRSYGTAIGIIDPYLEGPVNEGQRCWLFLYPCSITSLRHEWVHPAFVATGSRAWLMEKAARWDMSFDELVNGLATGNVCFNYEGHRDDAEEIKDELYAHVAQVTGKTPTPLEWFRCAC